MNFYRQQGFLILGTRLKRISDRFLSEIARTYKMLDIPFEAGWFPVFFMLAQHREMAVTEIARELEITHSAVSQMIGILEKQGLIHCKTGVRDKRRRLVQLTDAGRALLAEVEPVWLDIQQSMEELLLGIDNAGHILPALTALENGLSADPLSERIVQKQTAQKNHK